MKILFICGDYPPDSKCATADTSYIMVNILKERNIDVDLITNISWHFKYLFRINKNIKAAKADAMFIPYATKGYKHSIVPQILSFLYRKKIVILIHEVSQVSIFRKLSLFPFSLCKYVVFTNHFERNFFHKIYPWTKKKNTQVIPIGSNIHTLTNIPFNQRFTNKIVYFGQFRPKKGIEEILELAQLIKEKKLPFTVILMGRKLDTFNDFYESILKKSENLPIEWKIDVSEEEVSYTLGSNQIAYLPFPDGASERRGSLFAALAHKMVAFTNVGKHTPKELESCVKFINTPNELIEILDNNQFNSTIDDIQKKQKDKIDAFLKKYNWENIMDSYINLFEEIKIK